MSEYKPTLASASSECWDVWEGSRVTENKPVSSISLWSLLQSLLSDSCPSSWLTFCNDALWSESFRQVNSSVLSFKLLLDMVYITAIESNSGQMTKEINDKMKGFSISTFNFFYLINCTLISSALIYISLVKNKSKKYFISFYEIYNVWNYESCSPKFCLLFFCGAQKHIWSASIHLKARGKLC